MKVCGKGVVIMIMSEYEGEDVIMVEDDDGYKDMWLFDLGYFYYVFRKMELFFFYEECDGTIIILLNDEWVNVEKVG